MWASRLVYLRSLSFARGSVRVQRGARVPAVDCACPPASFVIFIMNVHQNLLVYRSPQTNRLLLDRNLRLLFARTTTRLPRLSRPSKAVAGKYGNSPLMSSRRSKMVSRDSFCCQCSLPRQTKMCHCRSQADFYTNFSFPPSSSP